MDILVVGSGGREHALCWKLAQSPQVKKIFIAPGNGGTAELGTNVDIKADDLPSLLAFAKKYSVGLVVIGPEQPLVLGLADALASEGISCFGPNSYAANLEGSKVFSKTVMQAAGVPTAPFVVMDDFAKAKAYVQEKGAPLVIKADGLAAGKGVIVAQSTEEAVCALEEMMLQKAFGQAGEQVIIEEALVGEEASFLAFCDGKSYALLPSSQDHKAIGEGDTGLNTGGMGAYSPAPVLPLEDHEKIAKLCIQPILDYMQAKGQPFKGVLYAGLMFTASGVQVLEYNVRFGDPECQPLLMRLETDLLDIMLACVSGTLDTIQLVSTPKTAIGVVMAAKGYPASYSKGMEISGIAEAEKLANVQVFQAGTTKKEGKILVSGGRVLCVTALADGLKSAQKLAYKAVQCIDFNDSYYRRDIGNKGIAREEK